MLLSFWGDLTRYVLKQHCFSIFLRGCNQSNPSSFQMQIYTKFTKSKFFIITFKNFKNPFEFDLSKNKK